MEIKQPKEHNTSQAMITDKILEHDWLSPAR